MSRFHVHSTSLKGLHVLERLPIFDERGSFTRLFCAEELKACGWTVPIAQINHTVTTLKGTLRGLHYQLSPHAEMKLVSCVRGELWDVAVDIRTHSPTFLHWHAERLSAVNHRALLIPHGFAHGFQALCDGTEILYCHSESHAAASERGLNPLDPVLAISWPAPIVHMSSRDAALPLVTSEFQGVFL